LRLRQAYCNAGYGKCLSPAAEASLCPGAMNERSEDPFGRMIT
jgi:hypothetical protein